MPSYNPGSHTIDVSTVLSIDFDIRGAGGEDGEHGEDRADMGDPGGAGGNGGRITGSVDVSDYDQLNVYVANGRTSYGGYPNGGQHGSVNYYQCARGGNGGGVTVLEADGYGTIAVADGGGGGGAGTGQAGTGTDYAGSGGGGGARGGVGGAGGSADYGGEDGNDAGGSGNGGDGGDAGTGSYGEGYPGEDGGATYSGIVSSPSVTNGQRSSHSGYASITITEEVVPPTDVTATAPESDEIALTWTHSNAANRTFRIYRGLSSGVTKDTGTFVGETNTGATTFTDEVPEDETTYYYVVTAFGGGVESADSGEASATTPKGTFGRIRHNGAIVEPSSNRILFNGSLRKVSRVRQRKSDGTFNDLR